VSDRVLESHRPTHSHSERFRTIVADAARACGAPVLDYDRFSASWATAARRIVLGEAASSDDRLTEIPLGRGRAPTGRSSGPSPSAASRSTSRSCLHIFTSPAREA
jgi:hypothetical protein